MTLTSAAATRNGITLRKSRNWSVLVAYAYYDMPSMCPCARAALRYAVRLTSWPARNTRNRTSRVGYMHASSARDAQVRQFSFATRGSRSAKSHARKRESYAASEKSHLPTLSPFLGTIGALPFHILFIYILEKKKGSSKMEHSVKSTPVRVVRGV